MCCIPHPSHSSQVYHSILGEDSRSLSFALCSFLHSIFTSSLINPAHIQQMGEMVPLPSQNIVGVCNQISLLLLYYISSRLVTLFKVIDAPIQVPDIFYFTVSSFSILTFRYSFFLFLKFLLASRLMLFVLSTLLWLGFCTLLFCFL